MWMYQKWLTNGMTTTKSSSKQLVGKMQHTFYIMTPPWRSFGLNLAGWMSGNQGHCLLLSVVKTTEVIAILPRMLLVTIFNDIEMDKAESSGSYWHDTENPLKLQLSKTDYLHVHRVMLLLYRQDELSSEVCSVLKCLWQHQSNRFTHHNSG